MQAGCPVIFIDLRTRTADLTLTQDPSDSEENIEAHLNDARKKKLNEVKQNFIEHRFFGR